MQGVRGPDTALCDANAMQMRLDAASDGHNQTINRYAQFQLTSDHIKPARRGIILRKVILSTERESGVS